MFDILAKEKQRLEQTKHNLKAAHKYSKMQVSQAKANTKSFMSSPAGIGTAFAAGAVKGATADIPTPPASLIFTLASEFL